MSEGNHHEASQMSPEIDIYQFGYPRCDTPDSKASSSNFSPFLDMSDDLSLLESGLYKQKYGDKTWDSIDSRLLVLLHFFRELFVRRREVFKKLFPELYNEFVGMFQKIVNVNLHVEKPCQVIRTRALCLQRSLSVGSPRTPSRNGGESPLRLERFKVRTIVPGSGGQGDTGTAITK